MSGHTLGQVSRLEEENRKLRRDLETAKDALESLLAGTRDPAAHGMGETWAVDFEMPPSTNKAVRLHIKNALAKLSPMAKRREST